MRRSCAAALLALTVLSSLLGGCGDPVDVEGNWMLVGARVPDGHWNPEDPSQSRYFLKISETGDRLEAIGFAGCQEYTADVVQHGDDLDFAGLETRDRPGCDAGTVPDPLEGNLTPAIEAVTSVEMSGELLVLRGEGTTLSFARRT